MRIEIVAVGHPELLLGQIADTNSAWLGDRLAANGVASRFHQAVGDNHYPHHAGAAHRVRRGATASSCAAASGRPRTTSPEKRSPRSWASSSSADQAIVDEIAAFFEARGPRLSANNSVSGRRPRGAPR